MAGGPVGGVLPSLIDTNISTSTNAITPNHVIALINCTVFGSSPTGVGALSSSRYRSIAPI